MENSALHWRIGYIIDHQCSVSSSQLIRVGENNVSPSLLPDIMCPICDTIDLFGNELMLFGLFSAFQISYTLTFEVNTLHEE